MNNLGQYRIFLKYLKIIKLINELILNDKIAILYNENEKIIKKHLECFYSFKLN